MKKSIVLTGLLPAASFACVGFAYAQPTGTNTPAGATGGSVLAAGVVGSLPACNAGTRGTRGFVTDLATATSYGGAVGAGSGTSAVGVICNGVAWIQD